MNSDTYQSKLQHKQPPRSLCLPDLASFAQQGLSLSVSQVPQRRWLALCPWQIYYHVVVGIALTAAVTVEGYKQDQGEEVSFIRTAWCVLNCVV